MSFIRNSDLEDRALLSSTKDRKYVYSDFRGQVSAATCDTPYGAPTGTTGDVNNIKIGGVDFQAHVIGTQTILAPSRTAAGLNFVQDLTNNDGIEYTLGCESPANTVIGALSPGSFVVGTDEPFAFSVKLTDADVSGQDALFIGFRKNEVYQGLEDDYADAAYIGNVNGDIKTGTILAGAATTTTDTTLNWADGETHTLTVIVDSNGSLMNKGAAGQTPTALGGAGKVYYAVDGVKPPTVAAFTFAAGTVLIPFIYLRNDATTPGIVTLQEWESGLYPLPKLVNQLAAQGSTTNSGL